MIVAGYSHIILSAWKGTAASCERVSPISWANVFAMESHCLVRLRRKPCGFQICSRIIREAVVQGTKEAVGKQFHWLRRGPFKPRGMATPLLKPADKRLSQAKPEMKCSG